jgi:hypothetical protein
MEQACVLNHRFRSCAAEANGDRYYVFENGKRLEGYSAAYGYCIGKTDASQDGECDGSDTYCMLAYAPLMCGANPSCSWRATP